MREKLPRLQDIILKRKTVLLRTNYDVPLKKRENKKEKKWEVADDSRIRESFSTINYLLEQKNKVIILSHLGRPKGKFFLSLSLEPVLKVISHFDFPVFKKSSISKIKLNEFEGWKLNESLYLMENLRFNSGEEDNDLDFAEKLAKLGDFFVNDAFACSHREHASIVGIPQFLSSAFGFDFLKEVEVLSEVRENPRRPVTVILGGAKADKLEVIDQLLNWADYILIGGKLPLLIQSSKLKNQKSKKVIVADLKPDHKDITLGSSRQFREIIKLSGTILWAGPMGVFEENKSEEGTKQIAKAVVESQAFKVVGGGDTEAALTKFNLEEKIDYLSSGGGAMFEFLAKGTLTGIEAIIKKS